MLRGGGWLVLGEQASERASEGVGWVWRSEAFGKEGWTYLGETGRALAGFLAGEVAQAVIFCFCGAGMGLVVESYIGQEVVSEK